ncbi:hypothetical protein [Streptomyces umbrinus]|uniref:hypothetical protein n=1 Tax=Streptomyces umbrinus TaxID=67370 RepID=UPI003C2E6AFC
MIPIAVPPHKASLFGVALPHHQRRSSLDDLLTRYHQRRIDRVRMVVGASMQLGQWQPSDGDLASAVGEFCGAYLTGAGEVNRYLAPGVKLPPVSPASYTALAVQEVWGAEEAAAAEQVPADGTKIRLRVQIEARDDAGLWPTTSRSRPAPAGGKSRR